MVLLCEAVSLDKQIFLPWLNLSLGKKTPFIFPVDLSFDHEMTSLWDKRILFNHWVGCYIFHSSPRQLCEDSTFWTSSVSLREVRIGHRPRRLLSAIWYFMFPLKPLKTNASTHYYHRGAEVVRTQPSPSDGKRYRVLPPFNLCQSPMYCVKGVRNLYASKDLQLLFLLEGICDVSSCVLFLCYKSNSSEEKFCHVFESAAQTVIIMDEVDNLSSWTLFQLSSSCKGN